ncbi:uncharacterized protein FFB20_08465 [Fusarium fujikuroi]|uniref:Uncharacterized protein n=2 Tax=Fusarium fujikuroi TaxID=5127 RepID=S0EL81_GIBF5|nr:uncharacterized protein FFUJ_11412 [Fusarium fujikuroi IMI 58289]KLP05649.1 uncharacterized protein Y057_10209 [Fusarium fujikuroi]QGI70684.1 hypothetical protein CEK27_003013 [Fusarium fujikuroi]QGJ01574.1 hypothetical protein CEK26_003018 [Fusarium fujikuroi]CCT75392.1 uncharacterized protein FFUJ_11412 [Fusarium fujikuroi IMI 58289]SCN89277.1 uncharacterized protein FFB20_08465 [Fusarium fujikuroi]
MKLTLLFFLPVALAANCWPPAPNAGDSGRCYWGTSAFAACAASSPCTGNGKPCTLLGGGVASCT